MGNITVYILSLTGSLLFSTILYLYLVRKTRIRKKFLLTDNIIAALISSLIVFLFFLSGITGSVLLLAAISVVSVTTLAFVITMIRFWRTPVRKVHAGENQVVSPADGRIIYINRIQKGDIPVSVKGSTSSSLEELSKTRLLDDAGWHIGINMTPFDVHKNCAPVSGRMILNIHTPGRFLSLKDRMAVTENERNTCVIEGKIGKFGVVQIASRLVRRIDSYVKEGDMVEKGEWIGMIRFGSQVDVILPGDFTILAQAGEQVFAATTVIAEKNEDTD